MSKDIQWFDAVTPDTLDVPECPCGNQEAFEQLDRYYICGQCHRWFTFNPESRHWEEKEPQEDVAATLR